jgi:hypothetical protein
MAISRCYFESSDMDEDELFKKWDDWLERILADIRELLVSQDIFWEVQKIIKANPRIHTPNTFNRWMARIYGNDAAAGIRRQQDIDDNSITLRRLLMEIQNKPQVLSRDRYVALYKEDMKKLGHLHFDKIIGRGKDYIDTEMVTEDLAQLEGKTKNIKKFVDKRIAHLDKHPHRELPTFKEVNDCLDLFKDLLQKYLLIFRAATYEILPVRDYDWKQIFREPWIQS